MDNDKMMKLVNSMVKDKIKQRDGYKLTGFAAGTVLMHGASLVAIHSFHDTIAYINYYRVFFYSSSIVFLVSLTRNIIGLYKYKAEGGIEHLKNIIEMLVIIFFSFVVSMLLWQNFNDYIGAF